MTPLQLLLNHHKERTTHHLSLISESYHVCHNTHNVAKPTHATLVYMVTAGFLWIYCHIYCSVERKLFLLFASLIHTFFTNFTE